MTVKVWLIFWFQNSFQSRELTYLFCMEVGRFIKYKTVTVAKNVSREPTIQTKATSANDRSETALYKSLTSLEVLTSDRHLCLFGKFPHSRNINGSIRSTHDERSTFCQCCVSVAHRWSDMLTVVCLHCCFEGSQCSMDFHINWHVDFSRCSPNDNDACTSILLLEVADVLAKSFYHFPTGLAIFYVVTVKTLRIILVKSSLHWNYFFQFLAHWVDVFLLQYFCIHSCLVSILRINIPCAEYDVVEVSKRNDIFVVQIFFVCTLAYTNLIVLSH